ncbi:MAG: NAD(+) synthase [Tenericutes bacterium]|nr:MAG: NAD(+) synthase [Mycoplasmatota bacterium]
MKTYLNESSADGFVIGISGGVDSALVTALAKEVTDNVLGMYIDIDSSESSKELAELVAQSTNVKFETINLTNSFNEFVKDDNSDVYSLGNVKARMRMAKLYQYAQDNNYLVLGCSNKSEIYVGYFTK